MWLGRGNRAKETRYEINAADLHQLLSNIDDGYTWQMSVSIIPSMTNPGELLAWFEVHDYVDGHLVPVMGGQYGPPWPNSGFRNMESWLHNCIYEAESNIARVLHSGRRA